MHVVTLKALGVGGEVGTDIGALTLMFVFLGIGVTLFWAYMRRSNRRFRGTAHYVTRSRRGIALGLGLLLATPLFVTVVEQPWPFGIALVASHLAFGVAGYHAWRGSSAPHIRAAIAIPLVGDLILIGMISLAAYLGSLI